MKFYSSIEQAAGAEDDILLFKDILSVFFLQFKDFSNINDYKYPEEFEEKISMNLGVKVNLIMMSILLNFILLIEIDN